MMLTLQHNAIDITLVELYSHPLLLLQDLQSMRALPGFIFGVPDKRIRGNQLIGWQDLEFLQPLAVFMAATAPSTFVLL
jgi:hypothetical protein